MQGSRLVRASAACVVALGSVWACDATESPTAEEAAFAALQARGEQAMGVDQYTSTHVFDALEDGGRIELQRDVDDPDGVEHIRGHLRTIAEAFDSGDFRTPAFVHMQDVPGTAVMAAKQDEIEYEYRDLPRGGELRLVTADPEALGAIHEFMAFQREDHRARGRDHPAGDERMRRHQTEHPEMRDHEPGAHPPHDDVPGHEPGTHPPDGDVPDHEPGAHPPHADMPDHEEQGAGGGVHGGRPANGSA